MSEPLSPAALRQPQLSPDEFFRQQLRAAVRDVLAWYPKEATHASVSGRHPETGQVWTAHGQREGPADVTVWLREGGGGEAVSRAMAWLDRRLERLVYRLHAWHVARPLRWVSGAAIFLIPIGADFEGIDDFRWVWGVATAGLVYSVLRAYEGGAPFTRFMLRVGRINGSFAGSLDAFGQKLQSGKQFRINDSQCEHLCAALLHRIKDFTALAYGVGDTPRLRATLAVPVGNPVDALRIWCYDETHQDRGHTRLPLEVNGVLAPGAPAAYYSGQLQVISDVGEVPGPATARALPYRSILSIPVAAVGPDGRPLAVVNIDADVENFFEIQDVVIRVMPLVSPVVNMIGLVLLSRRQGAPYVFPV
jgi:hypothetical protein